MPKKSTLDCQVICYSGSFDFKDLSEKIMSSWQATRYRNTCFIKVDNGACTIFPFGVAIFWNLDKKTIDRIENELHNFTKDKYREKIVENYPYTTSAEQNKFFQDKLELQDEEPLTLIAISHALAQSSKLSFFETQAQKIIEDTSGIPKKLLETGSTSLSQKQAAQMRGKLFLTKSDIILKYELLDTPEFFWEYPELEAVYQVGAKYLEIKPRTEILSLKLETIHELFEMLADDLKHQHSSKLEWIIIWLIAVEIIIFIVNDIILTNL